MNVEIAQRLATMRREKGYSQEALAEKLGLSRQAISKWERAESQPDTGNLIALADLYEVTLDELIRVDVDIEDDVRFENHTKDARAEIRELEGDVPQTADVMFAEEPVVPPFVRGEAGEETVVEAEAVFSAPFVEAVDGPMASAMPQAGAPEQPITPESAANPIYAESKPPRSGWLTFPYPVLVVIIYLALGFAAGLWHPAWIIFLTIPFYYWIVKIITEDPYYQAWRAERWR